MMKLLWNKQFIEFESLEWTGTDTQASRQITFTLPQNPYDSSFKNLDLKLGDLVYMYNDSKRLFVGTITSREKTAEIGVASYTASDFMHHLLRSNATYKFNNLTAEKITKKVCSDVKIKVKNLAKTKARLGKLIFDDAPIYDIIVACYRKAMATTKKKYMPAMIDNKLTVIEKGLDCGVTLKQGVDITSATYTDTTDNIINSVKIYNDKQVNTGYAKNLTSMEKYGVYQSTYTKEEGVNAKNQALAMLVGITKEASVEAIGNINAIAGKKIKINDKATGITGAFYISSDTHTFSDGVHTMSLELSYVNTMEEGAENQQDDSKAKPKVTNASKCYYLETGSVYHSSKNCTSCKGKSLSTTTVEKIKLIKKEKGANKGKRKYKACSKCWEN